VLTLVAMALLAGRRDIATLAFRYDPAPEATTAANLDISHSSLMRSHTVFENRSRGRSRLERPGYWQNRCGFACSPHFPHTHDSTPPVRSWTAEKTAESVKNAG
jgi:hypothetical protein